MILLKIRDINVTKYRKNLVYLQNFCTKAKRSGLGFLEKNGILRSTPMNDRITKRKNLTDFERGYIQGKHSAYNDVLIELHKMIEYADIDWENTHCREERCGD